MNTVSIIVPTVDGREEHLARCEAAYQATTGVDYELLVVRNRPTCGIAWQEAAEQAEGEYLHFSADDLEPLPGWWQAAVDVCDAGKLPAPRLLYPDGRLQACGGSWEAEERDGKPTEFTRVPFLTRAQWERIGPMIPTHYYTDNWVTWRGRQAGIDTIVCRAYAFVHHHAQQERNEGRASSDLVRFEAYKRFPPAVAA